MATGEQHMNAVVKISEATNGAREQVSMSEPWIARVEITGASDLLFHRWNNEAVAEKAAARKGSAQKKTDNVESYVYRNEAGEVCLPGEYVRGAIVAAAKFKAGVISLTPLASLGTKAWDYEDRRRVVVQRNGITRVRPAMRVGWKADFDFMVNLPEYIDAPFLREVLGMAGRLIGVGDFRPTYGRFDLTGFRLMS
jgi:hypothetical protein